MTENNSPKIAFASFPEKVIIGLPHATFRKLFEIKRLTRGLGVYV